VVTVMVTSTAMEAKVAGVVNLAVAVLEASGSEVLQPYVTPSKSHHKDFILTRDQ
jgi:hypothetical protein